VFVNKQTIELKRKKEVKNKNWPILQTDMINENLVEWPPSRSSKAFSAFFRQIKIEENSCLLLYLTLLYLLFVSFFLSVPVFLSVLLYLFLRLYSIILSLSISHTHSYVHTQHNYDLLFPSITLSHTHTRVRI
jgi:hypothetical protein